MNKPKFTPGEWEISTLTIGDDIIINRDNQGAIYIKTSGSHFSLATVLLDAETLDNTKSRNRWCATSEIQEANARLIVKAPKMYTLLSKCYSLLVAESEGNEELIKEISEVIAAIDGTE